MTPIDDELQGIASATAFDQLIAAMYTTARGMRLFRQGRDAYDAALALLDGDPLLATVDAYLKAGRCNTAPSRLDRARRHLAAACAALHQDAP